MTVSSEKALVLWGMMGSGKTTIGKLCAKRLGWEFFDLDQCIENKTGTSIQNIFQESGEASFRALEKDEAKKLLAPGRVIALGGGTLLDKELRQFFFAHSFVVLLDASLEALFARLSNTKQSRPLLSSETDLKTQLSKLLSERKSEYESVPHRVNASGTHSEQVADAVLRTMFPPESYQVSIGTKTHPYLLGPGLWGSIEEKLSKIDTPANVFILIDQRVLRLYQTRLFSLFSSIKIQKEIIPLPAGEKTKNISRLIKVLRQLAKQGAIRNSFFLGIGGGAACDFTALCASLYMRGVPFALLPTTVLAMLDASLGAKSAINDKHVKNLIGTFSIPEWVIADTTTLATLPLREKRAALAEAVKAALIGDKNLFSLLQTFEEQHTSHHWWQEVIRRSVLVKIQILQKDPFEKNERRLLNLGHTLGHAIEIHSKSLRHGEAVSIGMVGALFLSRNRELCTQDFFDTILSLLQKLRLPIKAPKIDKNVIRASLLLDKKQQSIKKMTWILPENIEKVIQVHDVTKEEIEMVLDAVGLIASKKRVQQYKRKKS